MHTARYRGYHEATLHSPLICKITTFCSIKTSCPGTRAAILCNPQPVGPFICMLIQAPIGSNVVPCKASVANPHASTMEVPTMCQHKGDIQGRLINWRSIGEIRAF